MTEDQAEVLMRMLEEHIAAEKAAREAYAVAEKAERRAYEALQDERWRQLATWQEQVRERMHRLTGDVRGLTVYSGNEEMRLARDVALAAGPIGSSSFSEEERKRVLLVVEELLLRLK